MKLTIKYLVGSRLSLKTPKGIDRSAKKKDVAIVKILAETRPSPKNLSVHIKDATHKRQQIIKSIISIVYNVVDTTELIENPSF